MAWYKHHPDFELFHMMCGEYKVNLSRCITLSSKIIPTEKFTEKSKKALIKRLRQEKTKIVILQNRYPVSDFAFNEDMKSLNPIRKRAKKDLTDLFVKMHITYTNCIRVYELNDFSPLDSQKRNWMDINITYKHMVDCFSYLTQAEKMFKSTIEKYEKE